ncbi:hypothetical protein [Pantoea agglomerans]|uniref:hypothetical protein n=1 Tax=Enterobacter agglomerans TaxID=549 RepID=UPI00189D9C3F|nr:hypothetical protein [Pantoea agglomerans]
MTLIILFLAHLKHTLRPARANTGINLSENKKVETVNAIYINLLSKGLNNLIKISCRAWAWVWVWVWV